MLNPSVVDLLSGVADALADTVLADIGPGPAADQVQAAVGVLRRVARALPGITPYLQQDTQDLAASLRDVWAAGAGAAEPRPGAGEPRPGAGEPKLDEGLSAALATADALPVAPLPTLEALTAANLRLREALADVAAGPALDPGADRALRALLERMTAREAALRLSPWER